MSAKHPAIVVFGGGGATGREIVDVLRDLLPQARIAITSRHPPPESSGRTESFPLDVLHPTGTALAALQTFDLAVLALGPFHVVGDHAHRLCVKAKVDCLDVVDWPDTARAVLALDGEAKEAGVRVFTGMGLNPGLSTHLLWKLAEGSSSKMERVSVALFAGGDEPAGLSATKMMVEQFKVDVEEFRDGEAAVVPADDGGTAARYNFPGMPSAAMTFHCTSAEPSLLAAGKKDNGLPSRISYRIAPQGMSPGLVRILRRSSGWRSHRINRWLSSAFFKMHGLARRAPGNLRSSIIVVDDGTRRAWATGQTTFGLTSRFAAAVSAMALAHRSQFQPGIVPLSAELFPPSQVDAALTHLGVDIGGA